MSAADTAVDTVDPAADRAARSAAARLLARRPRHAKRRRPVESLSVATPVDARTKAGRFAADLRDELLKQLGHPPSAVERAMVAQLVQLKLRLLAYDDLFVSSDGDLSVHDARTYSAFATSFIRGLRVLGLRGAGAPTVSLAEALAAGAVRMPVGGPDATPGISNPPAADTAPSRGLVAPVPGSDP